MNTIGFFLLFINPLLNHSYSFGVTNETIDYGKVFYTLNLLLNYFNHTFRNRKLHGICNCRHYYCAYHTFDQGYN
jgi:hypothetical protein